MSASKVWSPALHGWMSQYKNALVSKFSLYFYEVLCRQGSLSEVKSLTAKTSVDFYAKYSSALLSYLVVFVINADRNGKLRNIVI